MNSLSKLTLETVGQWPISIRSLLIAIEVLLLIGFGYWVIVKPSSQQYVALQAVELALKNEFEQKQQWVTDWNAHRRQLQILKERFFTLVKPLPAQNEMSESLEEISKIGIASGLTFELFAPGFEVPHEFYVELPINIIVVGSYYQLADFISKIAALNRLVTLHDFEINRHDLQKKSKVDCLEMKLTAKVYRYSENYD